MKALSKTLVTSSLILLTTGSFALAQDVVTPKKGTEWSGRVNLGGFVTDGNTNKKALVVDGRTEARQKDNRYTFGGEFRFAEDNGETTEDEYEIYAQYDRFLTKQLFTGVRTEYESDDIDELDYRLSVGPFVGYQFYEKKTLNLSSRIGLEYITEEYANGDSEDETAFSWGVNYDQKIIDETLQLFYKHELSTPFDDTEGFLFDAETGVRFPIAKVLVGSAQVDFDWDNDPAPGVEEGDTKYSLKLGYEF